MRTQTLGDKRDFVSVHVRNAEASTTIGRGRPVVLVMNGTEDGFAVVLPSSSSAAKYNAFKYGVALEDITAGQIGNVQLEGLCNYVIMSLQTRANTSGGSSFSTAETVALGEMLAINTVNNFFSTVAATVAAASSDAQTLTRANDVPGFIAQSLASAAGLATSTSETRTVITQAVKAMLRMLQVLNFCRERANFRCQIGPRLTNK